MQFQVVAGVDDDGQLDRLAEQREAVRHARAAEPTGEDDNADWLRVQRRARLLRMATASPGGCGSKSPVGAGLAGAGVNMLAGGGPMGSAGWRLIAGGDLGL